MEARDTPIGPLCTCRPPWAQEQGPAGDSRMNEGPGRWKGRPPARHLHCSTRLKRSRVTPFAHAELAPFLRFVLDGVPELTLEGLKGGERALCAVGQAFRPHPHNCTLPGPFPCPAYTRPPHNCLDVQSTRRAAGRPNPLVTPPPPPRRREVKQGKSGGSVGTTDQGKGKGRSVVRPMGTVAYRGKGQGKGKGRGEGRLGQGGRGRSKGGEKLMGTTAYGGKGSKGRAANGDRPVGAASCRRDHHTMASCQNPPPSCGALGFTKGTVGRIFELRENGANGTVNNGYFVPFLYHFPQPHPAATLHNPHPVCHARYPPQFPPTFPLRPPLFPFSRLQNPVSSVAASAGACKARGAPTRLRCRMWCGRWCLWCAACAADHPIAQVQILKGKFYMKVTSLKWRQQHQPIESCS